MDRSWFSMVKSRASVRLYALLLFAVLGGAIQACSEEPIELGYFPYPAELQATCSDGELAGPAGASDDERTGGGTRYSVRTPANYDARVAHPLLIVYAAATHNANISERYTKLTPVATAAGFIVAYADHRRLSFEALNDLASIPAAVAARWCVDLSRVYLTGHSDGGTAAAAMAFRADDGLIPAGIAPSAAGVRAEDLEQFACPGPIRVMVMHNSGDELFPEFGRSQASWWARCMHCSAEIESAPAGCTHHVRCDAAVSYCEGPGGHRRWPSRNQAMINFFLARDD